MNEHSQVPQRIAWLFVVKRPMHLKETPEKQKTWWCTNSQCNPGDTAFIFTPRVGIVMQIEILGQARAQDFCTEHFMTTSNIRILSLFSHPITVRTMKLDAVLTNETFMRRNFQASTFKVSAQAAERILALRDTDLNSLQTL